MEKKYISILVVISLFIIYLIANGLTEILTPQKYVINTYMYILLAACLIGLTWAGGDHYNLGQALQSVKNLIMLIVVFLGLFFITIFVPDEHYVKQHVSWTLFVICLGLMTYLTYKMNMATKTMKKVLISLFCIIAVMTLIAYTQPPGTFDSWKMPMVGALCVLILVEVGDMIFYESQENFFNRWKMYGWFGIIIFSIFVIIGTQDLMKEGPIIVNKCKLKEQIECVGYPNRSMSLLLAFINLFNDTSRVGW